MNAPTRKSRILVLVLPVIVAVFAIAAPGASAANYCVGTAGCSVPNTYAGDVTGLTGAITAANNNTTSPGADHVEIGAGEYVAMTTSPVTLSAPLTVVGAGVGATVIAAGANAVTPLQLMGSGANTLDISALSIRHEGWASGYGLSMGAGTAHDIDVSVVSPSGSVRGVSVGSTGTFKDSTVSVEGNGAIGIYMTGSSNVSGLQIVGVGGLGAGIQSGSATTRTIAETSMRNVKRGFFSDQGPLVIRDLFIDLAAINGAIAVESENGNNCPSCALDLDASNVTVVGTGSNQIGIGVGGTASDASPESGVGSVLNSYFDLTGSGSKAMRCRQSGTFATASLESDFVAAPLASIERTGTCSGADTNLFDTTSLTGVYNLASAGDYRPATGSPLIDAGKPGTVVDPGTEDADGLDRIFDGNGDLTDRIDIGAYEYQPAMKPAVTFTATPTPVLPLQNVSFNATANDPDGGAVTIAWSFGDISAGSGSSVTHAYAGSGDYTVVATATDNEGQTGTATKTVHVNSDPPTAPSADANLTTAVRGQMITFTASGSTDPNGDSFTYQWSFTGGGTATGASVQRAATTLGTFTATVRAVDSHNEESASDAVSVTINNRPPGVPTVNKNAPTGFRGDTFTFNDTTTDPDGDTMSRIWNYGDGVITVPMAAGSVTHAYSTVGVKTVSVTAADAYGGSTTGSTTVEVLDHAPVLGALTRSGGSKVGDLQSFGISATDAEGDPIAFSWNFGDGGTATGPTATHAYASAGTFSIVASANDGQGAVVTAQTSVTIDPPVIALTKPTKGFKVGKKGSVPVSTSSATVVTLTLARANAGWVKGKRCSVKRPSSKSKKRCDLKLKGSTSKSLPAGGSLISFGPRWAGKKLAPGKYRLTASPDQGGKPVSVVVTIL